MGRTRIFLFVLAGLSPTLQYARAESSAVQGTGALSSSARIDFKIIIPEVLALRVGAPAASAQRVNFDPATPQVRVARSGVALSLPTAGTGNGVNLASNMRQVTVIQDSGPRTLITVATP